MKFTAASEISSGPGSGETPGGCGHWTGMGGDGPEPGPKASTSSCLQGRGTWAGPPWKPVTSSLRNGGREGPPSPQSQETHFCFLPRNPTDPVPLRPAPAALLGLRLPSAPRDGAPHPPSGATRGPASTEPRLPRLLHWAAPCPLPHSPRLGTNAWLLSLLLSCPAVHGQSRPSCFEVHPQPGPPAHTLHTAGDGRVQSPRVCAGTSRPAGAGPTLTALTSCCPPRGSLPCTHTGPCSGPVLPGLLLPQGLCTRSSCCLHCPPP